MKRPTKTIIALISIPIFILLFFAPNIYGYFRFKSYCSSEGGLRVYEQLEKNVGWLAKDEYDARAVSQLKDIGFVRYIDKNDGNEYDLRYTGNNPQRDSSFEKKLADSSKSVEYIWNNIGDFLKDELRLKKSGYEILDIKDKRVLAGYYSFYYSKFDGDHVIFGETVWDNCRDTARMNDWITQLNSTFKD